ncbi:tetratricopeptide repeat protein [Saccharicrinis sp. FJH54]|uniref:tetratricopeptide repeat protein n=1 Tax=Saccharicrinis sp. FJH54 TaxID=3344665 RepID=UPI0035D4560A
MTKSLIFIIITFVIFSCKLQPDKNSEKRADKDRSSLIIEADNYYEVDNIKKALTLYNELIMIDSTQAIYYYRRGYCFNQLSEFTKSTQDFLKSAEMGYRVDDAYFNIGCNFAAIYNDSIAIYYFKKTLLINPDYKKAKNEIEYLKSSKIYSVH